MQLEVRLFATFRQGRFKNREMELPDGLFVEDLLKELDIAEEQVGILLVNGSHSNEKTKLSDSDTVAIFPAVGGG